VAEHVLCIFFPTEDHAENGQEATITSRASAFPVSKISWSSGRCAQASWDIDWDGRLRLGLDREPGRALRRVPEALHNGTQVVMKLILIADPSAAAEPGGRIQCQRGSADASVSASARHPSDV